MEELHWLALMLLALQGVLGAFDTLYHHEVTENLPGRTSQRKELAIHSVRSLIYCFMFIGLALFTWNGTLATVLVLLFAIEFVLTFWDFIEEDKTRLLPPTERVTHTVLAINGGAIFVLLCLCAAKWSTLATGFTWHTHGFLSFFLVLCGIGVGVSGVRDGLASIKLGKRQAADKSDASAFANVEFGDQFSHFLVTGATGFIGQQLVAALLADGKQVTVLTRNKRQAAWIFEGQVHCVQEMSEVKPDRPVDVIVNLAGAPVLGKPWTQRRRAVLRASRIGLTQKLITWIETTSAKPKLLLNASAIGYYGVQAQGDDGELDETADTQPIFMSQLCAGWEQEAKRACDYGVRVNAMRFGMVLGHGGPLPMMLMPIQLGMGGRLGSGKQWISWIHIQDLIRAIAFLSQANVNSAGANSENSNVNASECFRAYNFTAPQAVRQEQFSKTAAEVLHRPCFMPTPGAPMKLLLGEQSDLLLEGQRVVPSRLLEQGFTFAFQELKPAIQSLQV